MTPARVRKFKNPAADVKADGLEELDLTVRKSWAVLGKEVDASVQWRRPGNELTSQQTDFHIFTDSAVLYLASRCVLNGRQANACRCILTFAK